MNYKPAMAAGIRRNLIRIYETMLKNGCDNLHVVLVLVSGEKITMQVIDDLQDSFVNVIPNVEIVAYTNEEINKK